MSLNFVTYKMGIIRHSFSQCLISIQWDILQVKKHLFAVQGTLKSPLHHHSSKASILRCSAFFMVQPSHPYVTTGKAIDLTIQTSVHKVMSLLIITLFMLVIALSQYILLTAFHLQVSSSVRWRPGPFCHCLPIIKIC